MFLPTFLQLRFKITLILYWKIIKLHESPYHPNLHRDRHSNLIISSFLSKEYTYTMWTNQDNRIGLNWKFLLPSFSHRGEWLSNGKMSPTINPLPTKFFNFETFRVNKVLWTFIFLHFHLCFQKTVFSTQGFLFV